MERLERLTESEIENATPREQSLAVVAGAAGDVLEAVARLRGVWDRHQREHGPERDELARETVRRLLGRER